MVLKRQQFEDSGSDEIEPRGSKCQRLDLRDNEKKDDLDKFESDGEREGIGYVLLLFVASLQKEDNSPIDMSKRTKSLNHLVCIPKNG